MPLTIRGRPIHFSLKWLKPPPLPPDGNMTLFEHLRELRYRLVLACLAILVFTIAAFVFNQQLVDLLTHPYNRAIALAKESHPELNARIIISGATAPFTVALKISLLAGLMAAAPIWLYQVWAFIVPGLLAKEKKWTMIVVGTATPLFLFGVALGYYIMPKALAILIGFTPTASSIDNLQDLGDFLSFMTRLMLVFGLAFEVPLFILMLNIVGVLPAKLISKYRTFIIFGMFVFAALATPTPDAMTMLLLAIPMTLLVVISEVIAHILDRRKVQRAEEGEGDIDLKGSVDDDIALKALSADDPDSEQPVAAAKARANGATATKVNGHSTSSAKPGASKGLGDADDFKKLIDGQGES